MTAIWFVALDTAGVKAEWDVATLGPPDPRDLLSVRRPSSGAFSRHLPASAFSTTVGAHLEVESGLEHDLLRTLDRRADVVHLVAQPLSLHFPSEPGRAPSHQPDLMSLTSDGVVTVWDARPAERQDDLFQHRAKLTASACSEVGWDYETFAGLPTVTRMNTLWLAGYRRPMPWHAARRDDLKCLLQGGVCVADVMVADVGDGELISTLWHLMWSGELVCHLDAKVDRTTALSWSTV